MSEIHLFIDLKIALKVNDVVTYFVIIVCGLDIVVHNN